MLFCVIAAAAAAVTASVSVVGVVAPPFNGGDDGGGSLVCGLKRSSSLIQGCCWSADPALAIGVNGLPPLLEGSLLCVALMVKLLVVPACGSGGDCGEEAEDSAEAEDCTVRVRVLIESMR